MSYQSHFFELSVTAAFRAMPFEWPGTCVFPEATIRTRHINRENCFIRIFEGLAEWSKVSGVDLC